MVLGQGSVHIKAAILMIVGLSMAACSTSTIVDRRFEKKPAPAAPLPLPAEKKANLPTTSSGTTTKPEAISSPVITPKPTQPTRQLADGAQLPVVQSLLNNAESAILKGDLESASRSLERAQRLAPQSVAIYKRLASVRLQQGRAAEAEQFARKALVYATEAAQQSALWRLIAEAQQQQGNNEAAAESRAKAAQQGAAWQMLP